MNDITHKFTTNLLHDVSLYYSTELLRVSALYPGLVQGVTSLVEEYSAYGNLQQTVGRL